MREIFNKFIRTIAREQKCKSCYVSEYEIDQAIAQIKEKILKALPEELITHGIIGEGERTHLCECDECYENDIFNDCLSEVKQTIETLCS